jgi:hypothetical protein
LRLRRAFQAEDQLPRADWGSQSLTLC